MKISFDRFVLNEIGSGNSNFIVPSLKTKKKCVFYREDATVLIDSAYTETNEKPPYIYIYLFIAIGTDPQPFGMDPQPFGTDPQHFG